MGGLSVIHVTAVEVVDPFARAYANLAITCIYDFMNKRSDVSDQSLKRASYYSNRAIEVDKSLPTALGQGFCRNVQPGLYKCAGRRSTGHNADAEISLDWIEQTLSLQDPVQGQHRIDALHKAELSQ